MKLAVQKNHLEVQILYRSLAPSKKRRQSDYQSDGSSIIYLMDAKDGAHLNHRTKVGEIRLHTNNRQTGRFYAEPVFTDTDVDRSLGTGF